MEKSIERLIDTAKWTSIHSLMFASLAIGYFMWGVIASIAPLIYPNINSVLFLLTPTFATLAGNLILSLFSDKKLGRKTTFFITMSLYSVGTILLVLASVLAGFSTDNLAKFPSLILIILGIVLGIFGVEGEVPVMLSYTAEMMPLKYRDMMLVLAPNFDNIGAMVAALVGYLTYSLSNSFIIELLALSVVAILGIVTAVIIRLLLPESVRWLATKGDINKAKIEASKVVKDGTTEVKEVNVNKKLSLGSRYAFLAIIGLSQYLTYGLMAFVVADYYFSSSQTPFIIFIANLGASISGFIAAYIVNKIRTRIFALISYVGGSLSMIPILYLTTNFNFAMFYSLLIVNMLFSEFGWAIRTIYEPVLMPKKLRAFMIGLIRLVPITAYAISTYVTQSFNLTNYILYNTILWLIGGIATIIWYFKGIDTNYVSLEEVER
ncbi:MFS transporter [Saccharolobus islandicus]|uniref:Major facilitator superfamily MFS_1 n=2 Tax=Saccharolobus islandicus TaxID=43080 RepID=C4KEH6_SACI6|nr:MFS transporter [Sulfolobus islandicus]ACP54517.1 major facilitator superfamily MFS_1 [Sulfolobus islandicus M.16.27]ACR41173.1 major facilitator superfamily MFS_1 [Sulfolobus islandicus M.16.4]